MVLKYSPGIGLPAMQRLSPEMQESQASSISGQFSKRRHSVTDGIKVNHLQLTVLLQIERHSSTDNVGSAW